VTIPSVDVPDLRVYQRYLPGKWGVALMGGQGSLSGTAAYSELAVTGELSLTSSNAILRVKEYRFETSLDLGLEVEGEVSESATVDISGTRLRLDRARLASAKKGASEPWSLSFTIDQGALGVAVPEGETAERSPRRLSARFREQGLKAVLASADADLDSRLEVSDLGWVNLLFKNPFGLAISGSGAIDSDLRVRGGWLSKGTRLSAQPEGLGIRVLDYSAQGRGRVSLEVLKGGERPDIRVDADLHGARLKRLGEESAIVQDVKLEVSAVATSIGLDRGGSVAGLDLRIPSARVKDMSVYNQYLPAKVPLELLSGEADLTADVHLEPESAGGFVRMKTEGLRSRLDEQEVSGRLTLDIQLRGGVPAAMDFDISGSSLLLDGFQVSGEQKRFDAAGWQARFDLSKARAVWKKPARLDLEAEIEMVDSRPIVAMFANQRGKEGWLDKILTVGNVKGHGDMQIDNGRALVPYAMVGSDKIDVGFKGLAVPGRREGVFYARFRKLDGILKVKDGERNFDLLGAKRTFDAYAPGEAPLKLKGRQAETEKESPAREGSEQRGSGAQRHAFGSFGVE
jgi:translocation and assembly module TamB